jgi:protein TonB
MNSAGRITSCDIISENPKGYGFGQATVKAFIRHAKVKPASVGGELRDGDRRKFTYKWQLD